MDGFTAGFIAGATIGGAFAILFTYAYFADKRDDDEALMSWLVSDLDELSKAESSYRSIHDEAGDGSNRTGRAWDRMRFAGDQARRTVWEFRRDRKLVVAARKAAA